MITTDHVLGIILTLKEIGRRSHVSSSKESELTETALGEDPGFSSMPRDGHKGLSQLRALGLSPAN